MTGGVGFVITELWAWIAEHGDGDEGVIALMTSDGQAIPLVAADPERLAALRRFAFHAVEQSGQSATLKKFTTVEDIETIMPPQVSYACRTPEQRNGDDA